jgi:hypothetical protein
MAWLICIRSHVSRGSQTGNLWIEWDSPDELLEADWELLDDDRGCGDRCEHQHVLAWWDEYGTHVRNGVHDRVDPPTLEELYPRSHYEDYPPEWWETPAEWNPPLERQRDGSALSERITRGQRIALTQLLADPPDWPLSAPLPDETTPAGVGVTRPPVANRQKGNY